MSWPDIEQVLEYHRWKFSSLVFRALAVVDGLWLARPPLSRARHIVL